MFYELRIVMVLEDIHSSPVLCLLVCFSVMLELVRVTGKTSRHRHRRHPSRRGLVHTASGVWVLLVVVLAGI